MAMVKHKWTAAEKAELVRRVGKANAAERKVILQEFADRIGNGISTASVQAQYYQFRGPSTAAKKTAAPKGKAKSKAKGKATPAKARKARISNGLSPVVQQLRSLEAEVKKAEANLAAAQNALATYRADLSALVG